MNTKDVNQALQIEAAISPAMEEKLKTWIRLYENKAEWLNDYVHSLNLPAAISGEFARLITLEMRVDVTGSARADWIAEQLKPLLENIRIKLESGCAKGGLMIKPISDGKTLSIDIVQADAFYPIKFNSMGDLYAVVFVDQRFADGAYFTRLEYHDLTDVGVEIINKAYRSTAQDELGQQIKLSDAPIEAWKTLQESATFKGAKQPLYGYFRFPVGNNIDSDSPLGVSCFARAVDLFEDTDNIYSDFLWDFESGKRAIDVDELAFEEIDGERVIPDKRLYRTYQTSGNSIGSKGGDLFEAWSPELREASYKTGLNMQLRTIEFLVSLAYGSLSNPETVEKTAEEIKASKQRSYATVADAQKSLQHCIDHVIYAINALATAYKLAPKGKYTVVYDFDDSLITDYDGQHAQDLAEVGSNIMSRLEFRMRNKGETKEQAKKMLALVDAEQSEGLFDEDEEGEGGEEGDEGS